MKSVWVVIYGQIGYSPDTVTTWEDIHSIHNSEEGANIEAEILAKRLATIEEPIKEDDGLWSAGDKFVCVIEWDVDE